MDSDSLVVCRGNDQEIPAKITQRVVLSFVSAVFDPIGICSPFTIRMRFLLKSIWASMGQSWDKELSSEHVKVFKNWCSELQEVRTMSINPLYFDSGCTKLRLHVFTDASEEAMCIVAYLQDDTTLKLSYVIGKCRVAPIRHMTIPKLELQAEIKNFEKMLTDAQSLQVSIPQLEQNKDQMLMQIQDFERESENLSLELSSYEKITIQLN